MSKQATAKAGPSKLAPVLDSVRLTEAHHTTNVTAAQGKGKEPVKRKKKAEETGEGPARKKKVVKGDIPVVERSLSRDVDQPMVCVDGSKMTKTSKSSRNTDPSSSKAKLKKAKAPHILSNSLKPSSDHSPPSTLDINPLQLAEMQGMIIESFAVSRASSLPASALYRNITDNRPSLKSERSEEKWMEIIKVALEDGQSNSGVFGKVESSFKVSYIFSCPAV
jgi:hypothetical protein